MDGIPLLGVVHKHQFTAHILRGGDNFRDSSRKLRVIDSGVALDCFS